MRTIKSYVIRAGRSSELQATGLREGLPLFGLSPDEPWHMESLFGRAAPTVLEIGFGMGDAFLEMAIARPEENFIGIEVHRAGVGSVLSQLMQKNILNVCICMHDALNVLEHCIPDHSLDRIQLFFPDPWPKTRHHKRRIVRAEVIALIHQKLKPEGIFHVATDWAPYAEVIIDLMSQANGFQSLTLPAAYHERPAYRPMSKYEHRGHRLGHQVYDLMFQSRG